MHRDNNKLSVLSQVLKESNKSDRDLEVFRGQVSLCPFMVQNPFPHSACFKVEITDEQMHKGSGELELVHNENQEWFYWFNEGKCHRPNTWQCLT